MRFYKIINNRFITFVGEGKGGIEISAEEYYQIMDMIKSKPAAPQGYDYYLTIDYLWQLVEIPEDETEEETL